ncbi:hypothetical protein, partial [Tepidanaerobacter syntrophicus]|uniref:hypothetical protein n=1 Tax=Tepidanaerobacter syntrophicus TaxID=224999 RepID=UPI001BD38296
DILKLALRYAQFDILRKRKNLYLHRKMRAKILYLKLHIAEEEVLRAEGERESCPVLKGGLNIYFMI